MRLDKEEEGSVRRDDWALSSRYMAVIYIMYSDGSSMTVWLVFDNSRIKR